MGQAEVTHLLRLRGGSSEETDGGLNADWDAISVLKRYLFASSLLLVVSYARILKDFAHSPSLLSKEIMFLRVFIWFW